jgi:phosphomannomutase
VEGQQDPEKVTVQLGFLNVDIKNFDNTDSLRITLADDCIIHLRPPGNAPELSCYAEADSYTQANECVLKSLSNIQKV